MTQIRTTPRGDLFRRAEKQLRADFAQLEADEAFTDREMLRVVLRNILHNAVSHSQHGGQVHASSANGGSWLNLKVANSAHNLTGDSIGQVFDRLWRGDKARTQTGEHFGLGLTITKRFAEALGGTVDASVNDDVFQVSLRLPINADLQADATPKVNGSNVFSGT